MTLCGLAAAACPETGALAAGTSRRASWSDAAGFFFPLSARTAPARKIHDRKASKKAPGHPPWSMIREQPEPAAAEARDQLGEEAPGSGMGLDDRIRRGPEHCDDEVEVASGESPASEMNAITHGGAGPPAVRKQEGFFEGSTRIEGDLHLAYEISIYDRSTRIKGDLHVAYESSKIIKNKEKRKKQPDCGGGASSPPPACCAAFAPRRRLRRRPAAPPHRAASPAPLSGRRRRKLTPGAELAAPLAPRRRRRAARLGAQSSPAPPAPALASPWIQKEKEKRR
ncbi:hypothetical protein PVAP13_8NG155802 [Panicum virgatum]|uniref:Uncharacterized protein n=1 Tax=Panicum virgatum TaxID=38727 RepID=A0A8T0P4Z7_PANVG|nr:hypothetical protein PVAP13_8NG155802 [Panicum virgatum]